MGQSFSDLKSDMEQKDVFVYKYFPLMMKFFLASIKNPKYCVIDISQCISSLIVDITESQKLGWISAFQSLSQSEFVSHFGIAKVGDAIDKLHIKYAELKAKWSEIFEDVPFDEFSASEHNVAKDLAEYGISNEELESLSAKQDEDEPKPVDLDNEEDAAEYDD